MESLMTNNTQRFCLIAAGMLGATAIALGAYHAHGLESFLEHRGLSGDLLERRMDNIESGVRYQMYHALALLGLAALSQESQSRLLGWIATGFILGTILFSGSLYAIVFSGRTWFGMVAPLGGLTLIVSWAALILKRPNVVDHSVVC
jgi:uncharacterized membrane protein YgdD (TMEM256/DUF423 family)